MARLDEHSALELAIEHTRKAGEAVRTLAHLKKDERLLKIADGYQNLVEAIVALATKRLR